MVMKILKVNIHHVKHFFFFFSIFLFLNIMIKNKMALNEFDQAREMPLVGIRAS